jgi:hypothetical protein
MDVLFFNPSSASSRYAVDEVGLLATDAQRGMGSLTGFG